MTLKRKTTKEIIYDSFCDLLLTNIYESITIKSICENCDVTRQHFYYYFKDKQDLTIQFFDDMQYALVDQVCNGEITFDEMAMKSFQMVSNSKKIFLRMMKYRGQNSLFEYLPKHCRESMMKIVQSNLGEDKLSDTTYEELIFYSYGMCGMIIDWYIDGLKGSVEEMVQRTVSNIPASARKYFNCSP